MDQVRVAIAGKAFTGKSSVAAWVAQTYGGRVASLADPVKCIGNEIADWLDVAPDKTARRPFFQKVGKGFRKWDADTLAVILTAYTDRLDEPCVAVDDARYPNELLALHAAGFVVIHLTASLHVRKARAEERDKAWDEDAMNDETETAMDGWEFPDWVRKYQTDTAADFDALFDDFRSHLDPIAEAVGVSPKDA